MLVLFRIDDIFTVKVFLSYICIYIIYIFLYTSCMEIPVSIGKCMGSGYTSIDIIYVRFHTRITIHCSDVYIHVYLSIHILICTRKDFVIDC